MKILVTGGAGFIGSHIVDAFISAGHDVMILDTLVTGKMENVNPVARLVELDIRSTEARDFIIHEQFDVIDHHAANIQVERSVKDPLYDMSINIAGTLNVMEGAKKSNSVKHVIMASSGGAIYGSKSTPFDESMSPQPISPYGISKRSAELYLYFYQQQYNIAYTSLRYANVYGPRQNDSGESGVVSIFINNIRRGLPTIINGDGKQTRDYVYVKDVADANLFALNNRISGEFNIGTNSEIDVNTLHGLISKEMNISIQAVHGPAKKGEQITSSLKYDKAKRIFGWEPKTTFANGLSKTIKSYTE